LQDTVVRALLLDTDFDTDSDIDSGDADLVLAPA
jgi:hypothetical protein